MIDNYISKFQWRKLILLIILIFIITFLYSKVYKSFHGFPAESIQHSSSLSKSRIANCLDPSASKIISLGPINAPYYPLQGIGDYAINLINQSNTALYFEDGIYFLDAIGKEDSVNLALGFLRNTNKLSSVQLENLINRVNDFYDSCNKYSNSDYGVTELYWAGKGVSILHHWAYLYDGALLNEERKSQYGNIIPILSSLISKNLSNQKFAIDNFVKVSLLIFYFCTIIYFILFWTAFKGSANLYVICIFLLFKTYFFIKLGIFAILLAPGYHWFRELVCLIIFFSYLLVSNKSLLLKILALLLILLSYLIDPAFSTIAFLSLIASEIIWNISNIRRKLLLLFYSIIIITVGFIFQKNNIINLYHSIFEVYEIYGKNKNYNFAASLIIFISLLTLYFNTHNKYNRYYNYFCIFSVLSSIYYFVNPDYFHFIKFIEYSVPMLLVFFVVIFNLHNVYFLNKFNLLKSYCGGLYIKKLSNISYLVFIILLTLFFIKTINKTPADWILRTIDSSGESFYSSQNFLINDRSINANFSPELYTHLKNFPNNITYDYIISRNDKYILFLYDRTNNLGNIDLLASINDQMVEDYFKRIKLNKSIIILDENNFYIDALSEFKANHPVLGNSVSVSYLQLKKQFYLLRLSRLVKSECVMIGAEGKWGVYDCS
jgi:hypothetical protein